MADKSERVSSEDIKAAVERYPGIPMPLAVSKYKLDQMVEGQPLGRLQAGMGWGGVHLERVGETVQKLAQTMYEQKKKSITLKIECEDFPFDWDHIWLEVTNVEAGKQEEIDQMTFAGWPCCACDEVIKGDDSDTSAVILEKKVKWEYPKWGDILTGEGGKAIAVLCGTCANAGKTPLYAIKKDGDKYTRVPLTELEDA
jgi:hypothetical protein